ncbi:LysR substrate-binding domain-containing protein [Streptomyces sp. RKAG293]|uniref:LysR substrate-binding domain-containing protein n=1 Tax=Streptomyces sp. RKAG293 TaxID=2893403 RepID=UPI002034471C|nr:LysR substrate-binding domain-containing protein [Streptomyces sp. RKAG293]MCM2423804.1 substrate-binding domain-containing protein [Streptomyces sp. RKAG293]
MRLPALAANDLALAWITIGATVRGIEQRPVVERPWVPAVTADDPLAAKSRIEPADLAAVQLVRLSRELDFAGSSRRLLRRVGDPAGVRHQCRPPARTFADTVVRNCTPEPTRAAPVAPCARRRR